MASKRLSELNPAEEAVAQFMSAQLMAWVGSRVAARMVGCSPSLLWKWGRGKVSPTMVKFRYLQSAYEDARERYRVQTTQFP